MKDPNNPCLFCNTEESGFTTQIELAYASYDTYPVSRIFPFEQRAISDLVLSILDKFLK